jgi:hypothetical protein
MEKSQFVEAYKKLVAFFSLFGIIGGLILLIEPSIVGLLVWPLGLIAYASGGQVRRQGLWLLLFIALSFTSLLFALASCFIVGTVIGKTVHQLVVFAGAGILLFVTLAFATTLIYVVENGLNKLRRP